MLGLQGQQRPVARDVAQQWSKVAPNDSSAHVHDLFVKVCKQPVLCNTALICDWTSTWIGHRAAM